MTGHHARAAIMALTLVLGATAHAAAMTSPEATSVDLVGALEAEQASSNVGSTVVPWLGLRATHWFDVDAHLRWGIDGALWCGGLNVGGTPQVSASRMFGAVEARGLVGQRFASAHAAITPYGYVGVDVGGGALNEKVFAQTRSHALGTWAVSGGVGAALTLMGATLRLELGGGMRDAGPMVRTQLALGAVW
jgi:hypothetical protein